MALSKIQGIAGQVTPNLGRRNMLINGDFQVWQRGTSGTVNSYTCDRWYGWGYQQALSRQLADGTTENNGRFSLRVQHNDGTANQFSSIAQTLETSDAAKARGKKLTFSIDVKKGSAFTGNLTLQIVTRTDAEGTINTGTRQVLVTEDITSSLTTSMQRFTCTTTSAVSQSAKVVGVNVNHTGTTGTDANNYFQVERAQLEIGEEDTDFEHRSYAEELSACQRYFERQHYPANDQVCVSMKWSGYGYMGHITCMEVKRTEPTVSSTGIVKHMGQASFSNTVSPTWQYMTPQGVGIYSTPTSGPTGDAVLILSEGFTVNIDAEI